MAIVLASSYYNTLGTKLYKKIIIQYCFYKFQEWIHNIYTHR